MPDKAEVINLIWQRVEELEAASSDKKKTALQPNKLFAIGFCSVIFLAASILLIGETSCWIALCLVPAAYLIDQYSWIEEIRNREAEFFNM